MKQITALLLVMMCALCVSAQKKGVNKPQVEKKDYMFILTHKPLLSNEYPVGKNFSFSSDTYYAISYDYPYAFIYNDKHCGYFNVPLEMQSGFKRNVRDLQSENSELFWQRVKKIMADIDKYWQKQEVERVPDGAKVCDVVEQMPSFPGGMGALMQYLSTHIKYPIEAENNGIQGRVICTFVIGEDGSISNVKVSRSVDPLLDAEAVRVISSMPHWIPGKKDGVPCRVKFTLPVTFKLQ